MPWLEMSRTPAARPAGWRVGECLWSPRQKKGGATWGFWETLKQVLPDDVVFHLCGNSSKAAFVGYSVATSGAALIESGPNGPEQLYRVELKDYTELTPSLPLKDLFADKNEQLRNYFKRNQDLGKNKERLFYVIQSKRLQCLNGAYLSHVSDQLLEILFGLRVIRGDSGSSTVSVEATTSTGSQLALVALRVGQQAFSRNVRENWKHRCCFPGCDVADDRFLVGAHIARWADSPDTRGSTSNGLCLCLVHDKAFEIGAFTFDSQLRVVLGAKEPSSSWVHKTLLPAKGEAMPQAEVAPAASSLAQHWARHGFKIEA